MPTYEYRCESGHTFEVFQRMSDAPVDTCVVCGESPVEKVLFAPAVHFKGSGFYSTDYGRGDRKGEDSTAGDDSKSGADSAGDKSGAKETKGSADEKPAKDKGGSKTDGSGTKAAES